MTDEAADLPDRLEGYRLVAEPAPFETRSQKRTLLLAEPRGRPGFRVVLKDYAADAGDNAERREAAARRAQAVWSRARWLRHPRIVRVHRPLAPAFLVMEWIPGQSLRGLLHERRPAAAEAAGLVIDLAEALTYLTATLGAHGLGPPQAGHGDISPTNIMVVPGADRPEAKLVDLDDIARAVPRSIPLTASRRRALLERGTSIWKPPECTLGTVPYYDSCANVFTLGVLCYRLLLGRPPFAAPDEYLRLLERLLAGEADLLPSRIAQVRTTGLGRVLARMTQLARDRRYPSVAAALPELRQALAAVVARAAAQA